MKLFAAALPCVVVLASVAVAQPEEKRVPKAVDDPAVVAAAEVRCPAAHAPAGGGFARPRGTDPNFLLCAPAVCAQGAQGAERQRHLPLA